MCIIRSVPGVLATEYLPAGAMIGAIDSNENVCITSGLYPKWSEENPPEIENWRGMIRSEEYTVRLKICHETQFMYTISGWEKA